MQQRCFVHISLLPPDPPTRSPRVDRTVCVRVSSVNFSPRVRFLPRGYPPTPGRFAPTSSLPAPPLFWCLHPSSSLPTIGVGSTPHVPPGRRRSVVCSSNSSCKSRCLSPVVPGSPPVILLPCVPTPGLASIYHAWGSVCLLLSTESTPCSTYPRIAASSSPPVAVVVSFSAPTPLRPAPPRQHYLLPHPATLV